MLPRFRLRIGNERCVDLGVEPYGQWLCLLGQVLGPEEPGAVELARAGGPAHGAHVAPLDAGGGFHFNNIQPGVYVLTLHLSDDDIVLPPFRIDATPG